MSAVVVSRHRCRARHRTGRSFARCTYPHAPIRGEGWVAVLLRCGGLRVELYDTRATALARLAEVGDLGCGRPWCSHRHELAVLQPAAVTPRSLPTPPRPGSCATCGEPLSARGALARCRPHHTTTPGRSSR